MRIWEHRLVTGGLAVAGLLFLVAAIRPAMNELPFNVAFFLVGLVCLGLGVAGWRKRGGTQPSA